MNALAKDSDLLIDVEVPPDLILAHDADGLPRTDLAPNGAAPQVLVPKPVLVKPEVKPAKPERPAITEADMDAVRRDAAAARQQMEEARKVAVAEHERAIGLERDLGQRTTQALHAHYGRISGDLENIESSIQSYKLLADAAKRDMLAAKEAGDAGREIAAQERLTEAVADMRTLEQGKVGAAAEKQRVERVLQQALAEPAPEPKKPEVAPAVEQPKQLSADEWIAQFPRKTASWLRDHKEYVTDAGKHNELMSFANEWVADYGQNTLHTPAFLDALNGKFFPQPEDSEVETEVAEAPVANGAANGQANGQDRRPQVSAPVSRSSSPAKASGTGNNQVRLTAEQYAIAPALYPEAKSAEEARRMYALDLLRAHSDGKFEPRV